MARRPAPLAPRKVSINGHVRWEVRVPAELQSQEKSARPRFLKESEAKGYCNRLKSDLLRYSDKARGLTDAQKIEAHGCFERLAAYPAATLSQAVDLLIARLDRSAHSFPVSELAEHVVADKVKEGGRGSSVRMLREIEERLGRFSRVFGERMVSDINAAEVRAWLMDLTTIIQTSRGKEETDQPVKQSTRHCYRRILSLCFAWAKRHGAAADNPIADVKLASPKKERVFVFTPQQTAILLQNADENLRPYLALCAFAGYRVTTPLRTIQDVAENHLSEHLLQQAVGEALERGLVRRKVLAAVVPSLAEHGRTRLRRALENASQPGFTSVP